MRELLTIRSRVQRAMLLSMAAALATMALKFGAWNLTGSVGLFSDAVESLVNLAAAMIGFILLGLAALPADDNHPFGHEKAEYFASGAEGMMIFLAAFAIAWKSVQGLLQPAAPQALDIGLLLSLAATGINAAAAWWLLRVAHEEKSLAVEADARHLLTDVWTSVGVVLALGLLMVFPQAHWLDPLIALLVAVNILRTAFELIRRSVDGLMDMQLPAEELQQIEKVLQATLPAGTASHGLRTRQAGTRRFVEFNLLVPGNWPVRQSHALCDELEAALHRVFADSDVVIHVEPVEERSAFEVMP
ncbi:MAG: cation diffusion facilitator family transporter [Pedobacter sp.]|nr:cation diffusion facilitator family transporter [Pedobacter sp.]